MRYARKVKKPYRKAKRAFNRSVRNVIHSELQKKYVEVNYNGTTALNQDTYTVLGNTYRYPVCANLYNCLTHIPLGTGNG